MNATAEVSTDTSARQRGLTRGSPPSWAGDELPLLDRLIAGFNDAQERSEADLKKAVGAFRKAFGRGSDRARVLKLALAVHMELLALRRVEAVLRRLGDERNALLERARA
jgi:hypothetical protein